MNMIKYQLILLISAFACAARQKEDEVLKIHTPTKRPAKKTDFELTTVRELPNCEKCFITLVKPSTALKLPHHSIIYTCDKWNGTECTGLPTILAVWYINPPTIHFPEGTGVKIGQDTPRQYLIFTVHIKDQTTIDDTKLSEMWAEVRISYAKTIDPIQVIWFMSGEQQIPIQIGKSISLENSCAIRQNMSFRIMYYALLVTTEGVSSSGYVIKNCKKHKCKWYLVGRVDKSQKHTQKFHHVTNRTLTAKTGDYLAVRCKYPKDKATDEKREPKLCTFLMVASVSDKEYLPNMCLQPTKDGELYTWKSDSEFNNVPTE